MSPKQGQTVSQEYRRPVMLGVSITSRRSGGLSLLSYGAVSVGRFWVLVLMEGQAGGAEGFLAQGAAFGVRRTEPGSAIRALGLGRAATGCPQRILETSDFDY